MGAPINQKVNAMELSINDITLLEDNPRKMSPFMEGKTIESLLVFAKMLSVRPVIVNSDKIIIGGNQRVTMLRKIVDMSRDEIREHLMNQKKYRMMSEEDQTAILDYWDKWKENPTVPVRIADNLTPEEEKEFIIKDNLHYGEDDMGILNDNFDLELVEDFTGQDHYYSSNENFNKKEEVPQDDTPKEEVFTVGCIATRLTPDEFNALEADLRLYIQRTGAPDGYITYLLK